MDPIKVSYAALEVAADDCANTASKMNRTLEDLRSAVVQLAGSWQGEAQQAYSQLQDKWDESAADLNQVLAQIGTAVRTAGQNYQARENKTRDDFMQ